MLKTVTDELQLVYSAAVFNLDVILTFDMTVLLACT